MKIQTTALINATPERLWPMLTNSQMDAPGCFCLGVPRPVACQLPASQGHVGAERRCISDRGTVTQQITQWDPPKQLNFRMIATDHQWGRCVESIEEQFVLESLGHRTRITRTTRLAAKAPFGLLKESLFYFGLKRVHFFVFKNWRRQAEAKA